MSRGRWLILGLLLVGAAAALPDRVYFQRHAGVAMATIPAGRVSLLARDKGSYSTCPLQVTPDGKRVIYNLRYNLWSVATSGGTPKKLTTLGKLLQADEESEVANVCDVPLLSPNGKWLAYRYQGLNQPTVIRICRPDGTGDRLLVKGPDLGPGAWSPDSTGLVFELQGALHRVAPEGGAPVAVTRPDNGGQDYQPSFAADGRLAFVRGGTPLILRPDGSLTRPGPDGLTGQWPLFSPEGRWLTLEDRLRTLAGDAMRIRLLSVAGGAVETLVTTEPNGNATVLAWVGQRTLAFLRESGESRKVYALDVVSRQLTLLYKAGNEDFGFAFWPRPTEATP